MAEPHSLSARASMLRADQLERWQRGDRIRVEDYLHREPWLSTEPEALLDLIYAEVVYREEQGEEIHPEEYLQRFPQFAESLRRQFAVHAALATPSLLADEDAPSTSAVRGDRTLPATLGIEAGTTATPPVRIIGAYEILEELGRGGMGVVYKGRHRLLPDRLAAIKVIRSGEATADQHTRFRFEVETAVRLQHRGIVTLYDLGLHEEPGQPAIPYVAMEYIAGGTLAQKIAGTPLPAREAATLLLPVAEAVQFAHDQGVIHRDLKPANILLSSENEGAEVSPRISDFGLARRLHADHGQTQTGAILGTPSYMPPEQARGENTRLGPPADIYALGAILYEMLTGRPPFKAESVMATLQQVVSADPVPPRQLQMNVPRDLEIICLKCLQKEPTRRYPSAAALADDLRLFLAGQPIKARPASLFERSLVWVKRRPATAALLSSGVVAVLVLLGVWWHFTAQLQTEKQAVQNERDAAQRERDAAQRERKRTEAMLEMALGAVRRHAEQVSFGKSEDLRTNNPGGVLFELACVYAQEAVSARKDSTLSDSQRTRLADQYTLSALGLLRDTQKLGYFQREHNRKRLQTEPRLAPLRDDPRFKSLLTTL